jgi:hypothetical protein
MAIFVHLTSEKNARLIAKNGIRLRRSATPGGRVIFAFPVTKNYFLSNQWLRELKLGQRSIVAVHFRIPDDEPVLVGRYGTQHETATAAQAVARVLEAPNAEGYEVLIARRIHAAEIHAVRSVSQVAGWRHYPGAHGRPPCGCSFCQSSGRPGARKIRDQFRATQAGGLASLPITEPLDE